VVGITLSGRGSAHGPLALLAPILSPFASLFNQLSHSANETEGFSMGKYIPAA
jgi:hypothetical protein